MPLSWSENAGYQQTLNLLAEANGIDIDTLVLDGDPQALTSAAYQAVAEKLGLEASDDLDAQMAQIRDLAKTPAIRDAVATLIENDAGKGQAVIAFANEDSALVADGIAGDKTRAALEAYNASISEAPPAAEAEPARAEMRADTPVMEAGILPSGILPDIEWQEFDPAAHIAEETKNPFLAKEGSDLGEGREGAEANGVATFDSAQTSFDRVAEILVQQGNLEGNDGQLSLEEAARTIHYAATDQDNWAHTGFGLSEAGEVAGLARTLTHRSEAVPETYNVNDPAQLEALIAGTTVVHNWGLYGDAVRENGMDPVKALETPLTPGSEDWSEQIKTAAGNALGEGAGGAEPAPEDEAPAAAAAEVAAADPVLPSDPDGPPALGLPAAGAAEVASADVVEPEAATPPAIDVSANNPFAISTESIFGQTTAATYRGVAGVEGGQIQFEDVEAGAEPFIDVISGIADVNNGQMTLSEALHVYEDLQTSGTGESFSKTPDQLREIAAQTSEALGYAPDHAFDVYNPVQLADLAQGVAAHANGVAVADLPAEFKAGIDESSGVEPGDRTEGPAADGAAPLEMAHGGDGADIALMSTDEAEAARDEALSLITKAETETPVAWTDEQLHAAADIGLRAQEVNPALAPRIEEAMANGNMATAMHLSMRVLSEHGGIAVQEGLAKITDAIYIEGKDPEVALEGSGDAGLIHRAEEALIDHDLLNLTGSVEAEFPNAPDGELELSSAEGPADLGTDFAAAGGVPVTPAALIAPGGLAQAQVAAASGAPQTMDLEDVKDASLGAHNTNRAAYSLTA